MPEFLDNALDAAKPVFDTITDVSINMTNTINIRNNTQKDIWVMVSPNKDWLIGDLAFSIGSSIFSGGATATNTLDIPSKINNLSDVYKLLMGIRKVASTASGYYSKAKKSYDILQAGKLMEQSQNQLAALKGKFIKIAPGETQQVNSKQILGNIAKLASFFAPVTPVGQSITAEVERAIEKEKAKNKDFASDQKQLEQVTKKIGIGDLWSSAVSASSILNPSTFLSIFSATADMSLIIMTGDMRQIAYFNANSDHSWIVNDFEIVRAKKGDMQTEDRDAGNKIFANIKGSRLGPGQYMEPYDALMIHTTIPAPKITTPEPDDDGILGFIRKAINRNTYRRKVQTYTVGSIVGSVLQKNYLLLYQPDGNLVIYDNSGKAPTAVWSSKTDDEETGYVMMEENGNLSIFNEEGTRLWSLWNEVPEGHQNSYIAFMSNTGQLGYFKEHSEKELFTLNDRKEFYRRKRTFFDNVKISKQKNQIRKK